LYIIGLQQGFSGGLLEECFLINHLKEQLHWGRLQIFEGVPAPYDTKKREVVPDALRAVKLSSFRKFCTLGDLSSEVGWGKRSLVEKL